MGKFGRLCVCCKCSEGLQACHAHIFVKQHKDKKVALFSGDMSHIHTHVVKLIMINQKAR